jgi:ABC-type cobalamin/Fe3+-siderophores transport system ATPase subunit
MAVMACGRHCGTIAPGWYPSRWQTSSQYVYGGIGSTVVYETIEVENFRSLKKLRLSGLARVNLLVGENNSGKTSVLEALHFLATDGDVKALAISLSRREEHGSGAIESGRFEFGYDVGLDPRHLFYARNIDTKFRVAGTRGTDKPSYVVGLPRAEGDSLTDWKRQARGVKRPKVQPREEQWEDGPLAPMPRFLESRLETGELVSQFAVNLDGTIADEAMFSPRGQLNPRVQFLGTTSLSQTAIARLLDRVALHDEEASVVTALQAVENTITKVAAVEYQRGSRGIIVRLVGVADPVPLGSLGDGMLRMLSLALSLAAAKDGVLLIDEIDTGLHHTVMRKMWRLVFETATRLNVTVFATTHSYDCVRALAEIARPEVTENGRVSMIRIDRNQPEGVHFSESEITHLAKNEIEPR